MSHLGAALTNTSLLRVPAVRQITSLEGRVLHNQQILSKDLKTWMLSFVLGSCAREIREEGVEGRALEVKLTWGPPLILQSSAQTHLRGSFAKEGSERS